jgi:hypothetical protein
LIEAATNYGFIEPVRGGYVVKSYSPKKITHRELISNDAIWKTFLDDFNKMSIEKLSYSNETSRELDKIEEEIDG